MILTRQQREALKSVFDRHPLYMVTAEPPVYLPRSYPLKDDPQHLGQDPATYRQFRRTAQMPSYDVCVMVPWCGMWLGIEPDGYTHS